MSVTPQQAAAELLRRKFARNSLAEFAQAIDVPGKPASEFGNEDEWLFQPVETVAARHHILLMDTLDKVLAGSIQNLMVFMPPGSAKALALDTPIPTPTGWTTMGELKVGDQVFDENGLPCRVTWKSPVWQDRPVYTVRTDCGDEIVADRDHEWLVRLCGKPRKPLKANGKGRPGMANRDDPATRFKIRETHELARSRAKRPMIQRAKALECEQADLPVDPYLLGVWLGDGNSAGMRITSSVGDQPWLRAELHRLGYETSDSSAPTLFGVLGVRGLFAKMGLIHDPAHSTYGRKHIPAQYMRASREQRLALLQGLIDTDGTVCKRRGCSTFCNTNLELAEQVRELVRSLGVKAGWSERRAMLYGKDCGAAYMVSFYMAGSARLPRKAELTRDQERTPDTYVDVEPAGTADTVCIEVDSPSHLFLCGRSMTPTHNSTYTSVVFPAYAMGKKPGLKVIMTSYASQIAWKQSRRTRQIVKSSKYRPIFGTALTHGNQSVEEWSLENGSEYMAGGLLAGMTGNRAGLILIDDPVAGREDAESPVMRKKTRDAYDDDLKPRLIPGGATVIVQTRWHEDDLSGGILPEGWDGQSGFMQGRDGQPWFVLCLPALADREDDPLGRAIGEPLWPEWFSQEHFDKFRGNPRTWSALFQQKPRPSEGAEFQLQWVERYQKPPKTTNRLILVDPSSGKRQGRGDYTSAWVLGLAPDGNVYVLDMVRDRLNLTARVDMVLELHRKWKPLEVRYEQYGLQADIEAIKAEQERQDYRFRIIEVGGSTKKEDRIRRLIPWFEHGKLYFPMSLHYKGEDMVDVFLKQEYVAFPVGRHDDMLDALARLAEPDLRLPFPKEERRAASLAPDLGTVAGFGALG